jgi:short-subunit dehydrogenase
MMMLFTIIGIVICSYVVVLLIGGICYLWVNVHFWKKDKCYSGKHVFIFGASSGLGQAVALRLAKQENVKISIASRSEEKLKLTKELCDKHKGNDSNTVIDYYCCDVTDAVQIKNTLLKAINKFTFPDLIINCAGIAHPGFIENLTYQLYEKDMNLNYFGALRVLKESKQLYNENATTKKIEIVCVGSVLGLIGSIGYSAYAPTKYALKGLVDSLRFEYLNTGIELHYFAPSNMDTPGFEIENKDKPQLVRDMEDNVKTVSADHAAHCLLSGLNLNKYVITTEADLELLKNAQSFMNEHSVLDFLMGMVGMVGVWLTRIGIEKNIVNKRKRKVD